MAWSRETTGCAAGLKLAAGVGEVFDNRPAQRRPAQHSWAIPPLSAAGGRVLHQTTVLPMPDCQPQKRPGLSYPTSPSAAD